MCFDSPVNEVKWHSKRRRLFLDVNCSQISHYMVMDACSTSANFVAIVLTQTESTLKFQRETVVVINITFYHTVHISLQSTIARWNHAVINMHVTNLKSLGKAVTFNMHKTLTFMSVSLSYHMPNREHKNDYIYTVLCLPLEPRLLNGSLSTAVGLLDTNQILIPNVSFNYIIIMKFLIWLLFIPQESSCSLLW
jgi:hypothetical protein